MRWIAFLLLVLAMPAVAAEPVLPALTGRVVDEAGVLAPEAKTRLGDALAAHERATGDQVVVATVPSLQGLTIEEFANRLFRAWGLGGAERDDGVLLLVAPSERKVRIEVGYGLEGTVTDAASSILIQSLILPRFRAGDLPGGIEAGTTALLDLLGTDGAATASDWPSERPAGAGQEIPWPMLMLFAVVAFILLSRMLQSRAAGGRRGRSPYPPVIVIPGGFGGGWGGGGGSFGGGGFAGGGGSSGGGGASGSW